MAEYKQYVTQAQDNGNLLISEDVIATIVEQAVTEVEGVVGMNVKPGADIADLIGKKSWSKGLKITICENNELIIDCNVNVCYGQSVVTVAKSVQDAVKNALESTAGLTVSSVNVNICGIIRQ